ncbi:MAG: translation initiation factor IF-2 [Candidatus Bipolaricaulota bacterium]
MPKRRVYEIANDLGIESKEMLSILEELGMGELTPLNTVDEEEYELIVDLYEDRVTEEEAETEIEAEEEEVEKEEALADEGPEESAGIPRPPVISILGHIDHGKTTLLDALRETNLTSKEAGGITQSIGAYQLKWDGQALTFIDTPGHKAFTQMRLRGAQATDIAILVVAADDGLMDQTFEAIDHIQAADIPMIVAINKIDKNNADVQRTMNQLAQHDLTPEDWGGDVITVPVSALKNQNLDELLDMISLVAQMENLRADPQGDLEAIVIESHLDSYRGPLATAVIKNGTLCERDVIVADTTYGRIRALSDETGDIEKAGPGEAVEIMGLKEVPPAGAQLEISEGLSKAKEVAENRKEEQEEQRRQPTRSVEDLFAAAQKDQLDLVIKANTAGALQAVRKELDEIPQDEVEIEVLHEGVGDISESDLMLAASSDDYAAVLGFGVGHSQKVQEKAEQFGVAVDNYDVIYELVDRIKAAVGEIVGPEYVEEKIGEATVRNIFDISGVGQVAGCYVTRGKVTNDSNIKVSREGDVIYEGEIDTLKRFEDDVSEVTEDYECGIKIQGFEELTEGDVLEVYREKVVDVV